MAMANVLPLQGKEPTDEKSEEEEIVHDRQSSRSRSPHRNVIGNASQVPSTPEDWSPGEGDAELVAPFVPGPSRRPEKALEEVGSVVAVADEESEPKDTDAESEASEAKDDSSSSSEDKGVKGDWWKENVTYLRDGSILIDCRKHNFGASRSLPPTSSGYIEALNSKGAWRAFMEGPSQRLEKIYHGETGTWGGSCPACGTEMTRGISDHLPSQNHWRQLWDKLQQRVPDQAIVSDLDKPWIERFQFKRGTYIFNHVTGEQGFEADFGTQANNSTPTRNVDNGSLSSAPRPPVLPPSSNVNPPPAVFKAPPPVCPVQVVPVAQTTQTNEKVSTEFDLTSWLWVQHAKMGAKHLQDEVSPQEHCSICQVAFGSSVEAHILSCDHFHQLQKMTSHAIPEANVFCVTDETLASGPWVQTCRTKHGSTIRFNHVTVTFEQI